MTAVQFARAPDRCRRGLRQDRRNAPQVTSAMAARRATATRARTGKRFDRLQPGKPVAMQVVAITGASAGVGRATARAFGERGASVGLLARGREGLEAAARALEDAFGPIDVWVNNAMTSVFARFWEIEADEYRRATEVTYLGVV